MATPLAQATCHVLISLTLAVAFCAGGCQPLENDPTGYVYMCETSEEAAWTTAGGETVCGQDDPRLPPEPSFPEDVCAVLEAKKTEPNEVDLDTDRVQQALHECKGKGAVKLVADGDKNVFLTAHLEVDSVILWVDEGVTLYASRNADLYQETGNCGLMGISDSSACLDFIQVRGVSPGIVGDGTIHGQGGEPLLGKDYSWWQMSQALRSTNGSIGNPQLINLERGTTGFLLYRVTLHDAAKFHVKITASPEDGSCDEPGEGYTVWGVTILTPKELYNSQGLLQTPHDSRNSDGVDPGTTDIATCGVIACNTITTGDDQIAIKGGHLVEDLIIAHNHFGTGHGMSIGSETYGELIEEDGTVRRGVNNVHVYDLTIDATSRSVGHDATDADFNGIRIKSDLSRGGLVDNITYEDICMRDQNFAIVLSTAYNPLFAGDLVPEIGRINFKDVRHVTCMNTKQPVVTIEGHSAIRSAGKVTMDNVIIDNIGPPSIFAEYIDLEFGPGDVNFMPRGTGVTVTDKRSGESRPKRCVFPKLPAPKHPDDWYVGD